MIGGAGSHNKALWRLVGGRPREDCRLDDKVPVDTTR